MVAGARADLGQIEAGLAHLERFGPDSSAQHPRLAYAYADLLLTGPAAKPEALTWFIRAANADADEDTDALERVEALAARRGQPWNRSGLAGDPARPAATIRRRTRRQRRSDSGRSRQCARTSAGPGGADPDRPIGENADRRQSRTREPEPESPLPCRAMPARTVRPDAPIPGRRRSRIQTDVPADSAQFPTAPAPRTGRRPGRPTKQCRRADRATMARQ